jgi:predicted amidohydrolase
VGAAKPTELDVRVPVVVGQLPISWDVDRNREQISSLLREQTRAGDLVVLPEAALSGYDDELSGLDDLDLARLAAATAAVGELARGQGIHLLCGSLQFERGTWRNVAIYFAPDGRRWTYQKVNLAGHERGRLAAGSELPLLRIAGGPASVAVGVQLCREIRYPEQWHVLARNGAQLMAYLTYAANRREAHGVWRAHLVSRAAETQRFVLAANVAHPDQHCPSVIISPRGEVLAEAAIGEPAALRLELNLDEVADRYLSQQRSDVVSIRYLGSGRASAGSTDGCA